MSGEADSSLGWLVINTHPHRENLAIENLTRQLFMTYCPRVRKNLRGRFGPREVLRPLFPSYVFVRAAPKKAVWRPILSTYGVRRVVKFGDNASYIEPLFIEALQAREVGGVIVKPPVPFVAGQDIRIAGGPFDGIVAKIIEVGENDRMTILMNLLGQSVRGRIHAHQVSPVIST